MKKLFTYVAVIMLLIMGMIIFWQSSGRGIDTQEKVKVGLLLNNEATDRSWCQAHVEGLEQTARELNLELDIRENVPGDERGREIIDSLVRDGCQAIVAVSFDYGELMKKAAQDYSKIIFLHPTGLDSGRNFTSFFGRMYQVRYLTGIVAGLQTETNGIGYVAAKEIPEVVRGINAFTLGVRSVNPEARVYVKYTDTWSDETITNNVTRDLLNEYDDIDVLTLHSDSLEPLLVAENRGVWSIGYNYDNSQQFPRTYLTAAVWEWDKIYLPVLRDSLQGGHAGGHYWYGIETGLVDLSGLTKNVKPGIREQVEKARERFERASVFFGPIYDNKGVLRAREGENIADKHLLNDMNWYVEGVILE